MAAASHAACPTGCDSMLSTTIIANARATETCSRLAHYPSSIEALFVPTLAD